MAVARSRSPETRPTHDRRPAPAATTKAQQVLDLQKTAGNKAVGGLIEIQRKGGDKNKPIAQHVGSAPFLKELNKRIAELPPIGEDIPPPEKIEKAGKKGEEDADALKAAKGRPAVAEIAEKIVSVPAPVTEKPPGTMAKIGAFFSRTKKAMTPTDVTMAKVGTGVENTAKIGHKVATTGGTLLGQTNNVVLGMTAIGQGAAMAVPAVAAITQIVPVVNLLLAPLTICLNGFQAGKAWDRAARLEELLAKAEAEAEQEGHDPAIIKAVRGAMDQKYEQAKRKAKLTLASILSLTGGLLLFTSALATNPIGWAIGAALAVVGGVYGFYCAYRAIKKHFSKKDKGKKRKEIADTIWRGLRDGDALATNAVKELGLNPKTCRQPGGQDLIFARLTTG